MTCEIEALTYGDVLVLKGVSFGIGEGERIALVGPNGSGKSSLLRAMAGLTPCVGRFSVGHENVAYMPQDTGTVSSLTVMETVILGRVRGLGFRVPVSLRAEADCVLAQFGLDALAHRRLDALSGGQRQLVFLAQAVFRRPTVLLLDEPTAALDLRHQLVVLDTVRELTERTGMAVIAALHDLGQAARFAERVLCLGNGRIAADGAPGTVLTSDRIRALYRVEADVGRTPAGALSVTPIRPA